MKKPTSPISDLQRARAKARQAWNDIRGARRDGRPNTVTDRIVRVRDASADWNALTGGNRPLNIMVR